MFCCKNQYLTVSCSVLFRSLKIPQRQAPDASLCGSIWWCFWFCDEIDQKLFPRWYFGTVYIQISNFISPIRRDFPLLPPPPAPIISPISTPPALPTIFLILPIFLPTSIPPNKASKWVSYAGQLVLVTKQEAWRQNFIVCQIYFNRYVWPKIDIRFPDLSIKLDQKMSTQNRYFGSVPCFVSDEGSPNTRDHQECL